MPKSTRIPKYQLHRSTGHARVRVAGRDIFLGRYNSPESLERYRRLIAELTAANGATALETGNQEELTVVELLVRYLRHAEVYYRHSAGLVTTKASIRPLRELYGTVRVCDFTPLSLTRPSAATKEDLRSGSTKGARPFPLHHRISPSFR